MTTMDLNQAVIHATADALIAVDTTGTITQWNPAAERLLGFRSSRGALHRRGAVTDTESGHLLSRYQASARAVNGAPPRSHRVVRCPVWRITGIR
jgi:PAS domain-containing protein